MESKEERLLKAIFNGAEEEPETDNYPETITEKVGYAEFVIIHALQNIAPAIQRLSRLHNLLLVTERKEGDKLPDIITNNELRMALGPLLQVENDIKDITEMLLPIYRETKPDKRPLPEPPEKGGNK